MRHISLRLALAGLAATACADVERAAAPAVPPAAAPGELTPIEELDTTFGLTAVAMDGASLEAELYYQRRADQVGPRAMELRLSHSPDLELAGSTALEAATRAGKQLVVQQPSPGELRLVVFGTQSLDAVDTGPLARLRFTRRDDGPARLEVLRRLPVFAPAEANQGVVLPEPVTFAEAGGR